MTKPLIILAAFVQVAALFMQEQNARFSFEILSLSSKSGAELRMQGPSWLLHHWSSHASDNASLSNEDGLVLNVFCEKTSKLMMTRIFKTWEEFTFGDDFSWWLQQLMPGRLASLTVRRSGIFGLRSSRQLLLNFGSLFIRDLPPESLWIYIWIVGGKTLLETAFPITTSWRRRYLMGNTNGHFSMSKREHILSSAVSRACSQIACIRSLCESRKDHNFRKEPTIHHSALVKNVAAEEYSWGRRTVEKTFKKSRHKEHEQTKLTLSKLPQKIGIIVCSGNRPQYLLRALLSLLNANNVLKEMIFVAVGSDLQRGSLNSHVVLLLRALNLTYEIVPPSYSMKTSSKADWNVNNFNYYREVWKIASRVFFQYEYVAFVDEDVEVSKTWLDLLLYTAPLLQMDPTIFCVNPQAAYPHKGNPQRLFRGWRQVGWGFMITMDSIKRAISVWPSDTSKYNLFDIFILNEVSKLQDCVYPDISYIKHYGVGINTNPQLTQWYFLDDVMYNSSTLPSNMTKLESLMESKYNDFVKKSIEDAEPMIREPCAHGFFNPPSSSNRDLVFYFIHTHRDDAPIWAIMGECIGTWPYATQSMYKAVLELPQKWGGSVWLVGYPLSPFSYMKPKWYKAWAPPQSDHYYNKEENFIRSIRSFINVSEFDYHNLEKQLFINE